MRKILSVGVVLLMSIAVSGCVSAARKQSSLESQELRNQISLLEAKVQEKDREIEALRESLSHASEEKASNFSLTGGTDGEKTVTAAINEHPSIKQIQKALINAGYDIGSVDGKMGKKTREAVKSFQKAHNLKTDGKVGSKTWGLLKEYLYKN
ncbi:MAG: peptidoglycan-binding protein [Candidatus Omnitrophica bacterium]|nr:peptidoglycan-binding protein [Candidatus Omnitrophota bacterium]